MTSSLKSVKAFVKSFTPNASRRGSGTGTPTGFTTAPEGKLFPKTDPLVDGEDCLHDCESCHVEYPLKFSIDEEEELYGHVKGWSTHLVVATGKTDWVRDVADEKGSIMEAVDKGKTKPSNGKLMLSASNIPLPSHRRNSNATDPSATTVLLLPAFTMIDNVTPATVDTLITHHINPAPTNTTPLSSLSLPPPQMPSPLPTRPCPHRYLLLLCSQKTRDARCGQSAPLLRREFERHLRPLGLYRDLHDERPGGCGIYFISHVGGHKFSANLMVYRRADAAGTAWEKYQLLTNGGGTSQDGSEEANAGDEPKDGKEKEKDVGGVVEMARQAAPEGAQCIWLARVRPEDCENIVRYTVLQGKVVKPERQLRGGFDRGRGLVSW